MCNNVFVLCYVGCSRGWICRPVVGWGALLPVYMVYSGGFPAWGRFGNLGLGTGSCMPGELCPALLFGSTIVLEGVV